MLVGLAMDPQAMTKLVLAEHGLVTLVLNVSAWLAVGAVIGALHYQTLQWNVRVVTIGQSALLGLAAQLARLAAMAVVLTLITRNYGALPLLVATLGILTARTVVLRLGVQP